MRASTATRAVRIHAERMLAAAVWAGVTCDRGCQGLQDVFCIFSGIVEITRTVLILGQEVHASARVCVRMCAVLRRELNSSVMMSSNDHK